MLILFGSIIAIIYAQNLDGKPWAINLSSIAAQTATLASAACRGVSFRRSVSVKRVGARRQPPLVDIFDEGQKAALQTGFARPGDLAVLVTGVPTGTPGHTNLMRVMQV